ncbi:MAG: ATP-dependent Clp protease adaptor ClpS [Acidobacteria bacterium]|nr:ATP-dependent Clp protease adaptor ClpS [Acidobacteriota bacterium]MBM3765378.1 ATP-dependent Clp protease adaptor ClpS [Acidobacteriota bacterium]
MTAVEELTSTESLDEPLYHVVLLNDDDHTYGYILEMLGKLFFYPAAEAMRHAVAIDTTGRSIVMTCPKPEAEFARDQIHGFGRDPRVPACKGSMSAVVEPAR